ncbi:TPM domain-containing protein [Desertifilum sp. FACHB-1129]|uniref:Beta-propeller domain-containing protein, methanol dehydrogenase n=1 Tax=Desertifilum tharense IPPAS B-1220 TaxID=1781255 RepID=A0A1E5QLT1_9CYAN|nr:MULTISPECIES: TPM domain-containing protein [Desertifilum]MDA0213323.1 TPM domain-containing protein [Cyanobacteria bacterium FC1]MBD2313247.1 TPM domain-containing protein [Desertifilum sp. FACHB-1129]MBD2324292.1 TPM domain-containing protein [Desertifilum sp. FACHB-866]MBD2334307.1 TPM domain-containing protein [Desertifilum sp. FACHB-868]OEJ75561.1 beta-propeller domain-containing protein, methanol dehydrogenase [Desertifilum tharense IPPAS B-1220]
MQRLHRYLSYYILPLLLGAWLWGGFALPASATGVYQIPQVNPGEPTWVIDDGDKISRLNEGKISEQVEQLAQETGQEVRFVTIRRLDYGETIETFADQLFQKWFPTPEAQANQTLLVLDVVTNNSAIRTGEKVKTVLSEEIAQSVASETLQVPLREGDKYNQALLDASDRLSLVLSGQPDPGPPVVADRVKVEGTFATPEETQESNAIVWVVALLIAATVIPMATYYLFYAK